MAQKRTSALIAIFGLLLVTLTYVTERHQSVLLIGQYTLLFVIYCWLTFSEIRISTRNLLLIAIFLRLLLLFATPNLSEDVFRFIWDGKLWLMGIDAYQFQPSALMAINANLSDTLFSRLNSPEYYTIYPPINQLIFTIAAMVGPTKVSIIIIRLFVLAAEVLSLVYLRKLLLNNPKVSKQFALYAFNPLIIIELTGNLHFEAFVICFLLMAIYYVRINQTFKAALSMGLSISFKVLPIILLAGFFRKMKIGQYLLFVLMALVVVAISILPLYQTSIFQGGGASAKLYFQTFEFNASLYYLVREIGFGIKGYNIIQTAGPVISMAGFLSIILYNLLVSKKVSIAERAQFSWSIYCIFAITVHPWYILPLVALSTLTRYKYPMLWSFMIFLTYLGYTSAGFQENLWITASEYILVVSFAVCELIRYKRLIA